MREILFRGKGINDKEWRYGFYTEQQGYPYITPDGVAMYEVDVDTVGQYTGFVDKNGKKIFEGDIVSICGSKSFFFVIEWDNSKSCYVLKCTVNGGQDAAHNVIESPEDVEVVGNIYDNPELLGLIQINCHKESDK